MPTVLTSESHQERKRDFPWIKVEERKNDHGIELGFLIE